MSTLVRMLAFAGAALLSTASSATQIGEDAGACAAGHGPAFQVEVQGLKDRKGELWLELYPATEGDFLAGDQDLRAAGKTFRRTRAQLPQTGSIQICVRAPAPGRYALMLRHNRVGKDKFSFWSDGIGIPSNHRLGRHKPAVTEAVANVGTGVTTVPIRLQYLVGFGFAPLS